MSRRRYVIVVPASQPALLEYLERRFREDVLVSVVPERRRTARPVAIGSHRVRRLVGVTVVSLEEAITVRAGSTSQNGGGAGMTDGVELEDRQRVDRWLEESQYLLGRLIPGYLDDRDRLKVKLAAAEQEGDRLRREVEEMRREIANLQGELHYQRTEHNAAAEAFAGVLQQLSELQKPLSEVHRRLQSTHPTVGNGSQA